MIILDDSEDPFNPEKLLSDSRSVNRPATPTPSLPSYEFSQSQAQAVQCPPEELESQSSEEGHDEEQPQSEQRKQGCWPRKAHRKFRRALMYALVLYFVITVAVGAPIIVLKLRHHASEHSPFPPKGSSSSISLISDNAQSLPKSAAVGCNAWTEQTPSSATLSYHIPLNGLVFVQSNVSYQSDPSTLQDISGTLSVGVNADPHVKDGVASVTMHYSDKSLKEQTSVCLMNISNSNGLYLYVPSNLSSSESLSFNVTFLFPQAPPLYISEFVTLLPHFDQYLASLSEWVSFDKVTLGGPRSQVSVASIDASALEVRTALAEIQGNFNVTESLVLETVSASIDVNVSLHNPGRADPTFLDVSTGNAPLNASVCLFLPEDAESSRMPNFMTRFETFNAPLMVLVDHALESAPGVLRLHAESSVGEALVAVDSAYTGVFDVSTTFASADVFSSNVKTVEELGQLDLSYLDGDTTATGTTTANDVALERTLIWDTVQSSRLTGWVGVPPRPSIPPSPKYFGQQGGIEVISTLSPAALLLGT